MNIGDKVSWHGKGIYIITHFIPAGTSYKGKSFPQDRYVLDNRWCVCATARYLKPVN